MILIKGLNKYYNTGRSNQLHVLKNVTLTLPDKGMVAVFGRSGCGKTTLLNVVGGLDGFSSGQVLIDGKRLKENLNRTRNSEMGYIFQNYHLNYESNCFDNVADALRLCGIRERDVLEKRSMTALKLVGMEKYALRMPDTLSGGQQQRIAIARAIVKGPKIILADEPTGNLDEANTLMIMDLLKELSKDRLVLLVTHEADLVDHYCDRVVEIKDGRIVSVKENKEANGLRAKKKNHIYLGELPKTTESGAAAEVEFYGEKPEEPIRVRIVQDKGKTYLQVLSSGVQVVDENCEIKLFEGVFVEEQPQKEEQKKDLLKDLPPVKGKKHGSLFTFGSSLLLGYRIHFTKMRKKGMRMLVGTMMLLSLILVMTLSSFGTVFEDLQKINASYNKYTFYLDVESSEEYMTLQEAVGKEDAAIDFVFYDLTDYSAPALVISALESNDFSTIDFSRGAPILSASIAEKKELICGRLPEKEDEVLLSSVTADTILENSTVSFIEEYKDLLYTRIVNMDLKNASYTVVGVVDADEPAFYVSEKALCMSAPFSTGYLPASDYDVTVKKGEATLYLPTAAKEANGALYPSIGEEIYMNGKPLKLTGVIHYDKLSAEVQKSCAAYELYNEQTGEYSTIFTPFESVYLFYGAGFFVNEEDFLSVCYEEGPCTPPKKDAEDEHLYGETGISEDYLSFTDENKVLIHSTAPKATREYLHEHFSNLVKKGDLNDPKNTKRNLLVLDGASIVSNLISMGVFTGIICICIYFIMRSSIMGRVKEIGIYRAIGVSRKNLVFRFFAEALSLSSLTVGLGTVLTSMLVFFWLDYSPLMKDLFFYPWWMALLAFAGVVAVTVLFGILPILFLLLKSPSAILAKYDI